MEKILIPLLDNDLAPRIDMATDVLIVSLMRETTVMGKIEEKVLVMDSPSAEAICRLALNQSVHTVICAGIEKEFHDFLEWKGIRVMDDICGPVDVILETFLMGRLEPGQNHFPA